MLAEQMENILIIIADIENAMIGQHKNEEGGSFASLDEYKAVRKAGRLYRENHEKTREAVKAIAEAEHCSEQTAEAHLAILAIMIPL